MRGTPQSSEARAAPFLRNVIVIHKLPRVVLVVVSHAGANTVEVLALLHDFWVDAIPLIPRVKVLLSDKIIICKKNAS